MEACTDPSFVELRRGAKASLNAHHQSRVTSAKKHASEQVG